MRWTEVLSIGTSILSLSAFILIFGVWKGHVDAHMDDTDLHMPYNQKVDVFVPRRELNKDLESIKEIKTGLEKLSVKVDRKFDELYKFIREEK